MPDNSPMRVCVTLAFMLLAARMYGQTTTPAPDKDPFVGTWQANADKSKPRLDARDASYTRTITREGDDLIFSSRYHSKGKANDYRIRCDGQFHRVPFGLLSCEYKSASLVEGETKSLDAEDRFWKRQVSPDGRELTILEYKDKARMVLQSQKVMDRVR